MPFSYQDVIEKLQLEPLPLEGGYFRRSYETEQELDLGKGFKQPLGTAIYFLLTPNNFSALHWLEEDELYHFYLGDPVELFELTPNKPIKRTILGPAIDQGHQVQYPVLRKQWHGSRLIIGGQWALLGTTMAPGFSWEDFKLGERDALIQAFPDCKSTITSLTRT